MRRLIAAAGFLLACQVHAQELAPPSEVDLKTAYCLRLKQVAAPWLAGVLENVPKGTPSHASLQSSLGALNADMKRMQSYLLPRLGGLQRDPIMAASSRADADWIEKDGPSQVCSARCGMPQKADNGADWLACTKQCKSEHPVLIRVQSCEKVDWLPPVAGSAQSVQVEAPKRQVGQWWRYESTDPIQRTVVTTVVRVIEVSTDGFVTETLEEVSRKALARAYYDNNLNVVRTEPAAERHLPIISCRPACVRLQFPLAAGKHWNSTYVDINAGRERGTAQVHGQVGAATEMDTALGRMKVLPVTAVTNRGVGPPLANTCYYAPAIGACAKSESASGGIPVSTSVVVATGIGDIPAPAAAPAWRYRADLGGAGIEVMDCNALPSAGSRCNLYLQMAADKRQEQAAVEWMALDPRTAGSILPQMVLALDNPKPAAPGAKVPRRGDAALDDAHCVVDRISMLIAACVPSEGDTRVVLFIKGLCDHCTFSAFLLERATAEKR